MKVPAPAATRPIETPGSDKAKPMKVPNPQITAACVDCVCEYQKPPGKAPIPVEITDKTIRPNVQTRFCGSGSIWGCREAAPQAGH